MDTFRSIPSRLQVAALVSDDEFARLAALRDTYDIRRVIHPDQIREAFLRGEVAGAFIGAPALRNVTFAQLLTGFAAAFPLYPLVGVIAVRPSNLVHIDHAFRFGRVGVSKVVEIWESFDAARRAFPAVVDPFLGQAPARVCGDRGSVAFRQFIADCFTPDITTALGMFGRHGINAVSGESRFQRAGLPSPKQYIAWAKLSYAAYLGRMPGFTVNMIAARIRASCPQAYHRTVRTMTGVTAAEFRRLYSGDQLLTMYREQLIDPYVEILSDFDPFAERAVGLPNVSRRRAYKLSA